MAHLQARPFLARIPWGCSSCRTPKKPIRRLYASSVYTPRRTFATTRARQAVEASVGVKAAPEIDFDSAMPNTSPARVLPASPSYFTASPRFNDNILLLRSLLRQHQNLPTIPADQAPRKVWMRLSQYRGQIGETIAASKYSKVLQLLNRLNRIHPQLRPKGIEQVMAQYLRPGSADIQRAKPGTIDEYGRSRGIGRRKESSARVYLVEGDGQILVNGKSVLQVFPRLHDRESALWALKVTERMDKYNVFALVEGGGTTGQAESITLALAKALLVHEPALKPTLRRAGCVTSDARRVERKKPGRLKARKKPAWVKR